MTLHSQNIADPVQDSTSLQPNHPQVAAAGRFAVFPATESVEIHWVLADWANIAAAVLLCFRQGSQVPIWTHDVVLAGDNGHYVWDGRTTAGAPEFPDNFLSEGSSPYKLVMLIQPRPGVQVLQGQAMTYFDVQLEHKWKAQHYVPTTNLGRFGLELDPTVNEVQVTVRFFCIEVASGTQTFSQTIDHYANEITQRVTQMWNNKYGIRHAGAGQSWRVSVAVEHAGTARIDYSTAALEDCPPEIVEQFMAANAQLCVFLYAGRGQSNLSLRAGSKAGNVVLYTDAAFETQHSATLGPRGMMGQKQRLDRGMTSTIAAAALPHAVHKEALPDCGPSVVVDFLPNSAVLAPHTQAALQALAGLIAECQDGITLEAWVHGLRTGAEPAGGGAQPLEALRATAVEAILTAGGVAVAGTTSAPGAAAEVTIKTCYRTDPERTAFETQTIDYCAATHEFSHAMGLPDEYADYNSPGPWQAAATSQVVMTQMAQAENVALWPMPYGEHTDLMSIGTAFRERYYLPLLEALRTLTGIGDGQADAGFTLEPAGVGVGPIPAYPYAPAIGALQEGQRLIATGITVVATITQAMAATAIHAGAARVVYTKILDRATLNPVAAVTGPNDHLLLVIGIQHERKLLQCALYVNPRLVEPIVEVPNHTVLDANTHRYTVYQRTNVDPQRQPIRLRCDGPFTGHGVFTCASNNIRFYDAAQNGNQVIVAAGHHIPANQLLAGTTLYAEGTWHNADMNLALVATAGQVSANAPQAVLDYQLGTPHLEVYPFSVDDTEVLEPLSHQQRLNPRAIIPVTANLPHLAGLRTKVVVWLPQGFNTDVKFRVKTARMSQPCVRIYKDGSNETKGKAHKRGTDKWIEYTLHPGGGSGHHFGNGQARHQVLWLEGLLCQEPEIQLVSIASNHGVPNAIYDQFTAQIVVLPSMTVKIPATGPLTARPLSAENDRPDAQTFDAAVNAQVHGANAPNKSRDFDRNPPLVLIKGANPANLPVKVTSRYSPLQASVQWYCERAADDAAGIAQNNPHNSDTPLRRLAQRPLANSEGEVDVELPTTAAGSFHVLMKVGGSTAYILNVVVVEVTAQAGPEVPNVANLLPQKQAITAGFHQNALVVRSAPVPFPNPTGVAPAVLANGACAVLAGRVLAVGGGADGKRGVDRVFVGWIQNKIHSRLEGDYHDGPAHADYTAPGMFVQNQAQGTLLQIAGGADRHFGGGMPAPVPIQHPNAPLLDTGREHVGGSNCRLGSSTMARHVVALGEELTAVSVDSPGTEFLVSHFVHRDALLTEARYEHTFRSFLCAWTDATMADAGGAGPGELLYASVGQVEWGFQARWTVAWPPNVAAASQAGRQGIPNWITQAVITADPAHDYDVTITAAYARYAARPAEGLVEVRLPAPIRTFAWDWR